MTPGILQRHAAIAFYRSARGGSASFTGYLACSRTEWQMNGRRWQSTATKPAPVSSEVQEVTNGNEIPAECFLELAIIPTPSLSRAKPEIEVDLSTTRPAKLESPPPLERRDYPDGNIPLGDRVKSLYKLGKSFLLFYKTGLKNVWSNSKQYRLIRNKLAGNQLNTVAKYGGQTIDNKTIPSISRSEYQLSLRTRHDLLKMIPFSLVFIICGEFTPLVIVALGSAVVPYTCRIPRQMQKDLEKKLRQDHHYMDYLPRIQANLELPLENTDWQVEHLEAYRLGLTSIRTPIPILGPIIHNLLTRPKLVRHCDNLVSDTLLIHREGGASKLSYEDIYEWAEAYGLYALRQYIEECQKDGQDIMTEKLKTKLLPSIDAEIRYILDQTADWARLKPDEQWRLGLRTVGSQSPDWKARVADIRKMWKQA